VGVAQIFQFPTVEQLAQHAIPIVRESSPRRSSSATAFHDEVNQTATLGLSSPIQQLFFELCPQGHNRFTQQFLLQVSKPQRAPRVREAMESLVARHAILGARFEKLAKVGWSQVVPDGVRPRFSFREHILNGIGNGCMREILENSQNSLDITAGRLVAVDLINTPAHCQYLSLMVHHLVLILSVKWFCEWSCRSGFRTLGFDSQGFINWFGRFTWKKCRPMKNYWRCPFVVGISICMKHCPPYH
jgi:hypothetical protein